MVVQLPRIPLVVLDTETTGFVPRVHRVIEFACVGVENGKVLEEYEQLFAAQAVPPHVEVLTRIRTADLQGKPAFEKKRSEILTHLPEHAVIVGQNVNFDLGMLRGEGIDLTDRPWIDTSMLASLVFPELESYSLGYLSTVLGLNHDPPHRALGDVRATLELLSKCWERLLELPPALHASAKEIMGRSAPGYRLLFDALPPPTAKKTPAWIGWKPLEPDASAALPPLTIDAPQAGSVSALEEPIDPRHLHALIDGALRDGKPRWIAVKNLRTILLRFPPNLRREMETNRLRVLRPAQMIFDLAAAQAMAAQKTLTADEATLLLKVSWYKPTYHDDLPVHGGEEAVWNGKLSATDAAPAYVDQFCGVDGVVLLDHRELLQYIDSPQHPAQACLKSNPHIIIDDASMLEDTATRAYGWYCALDDMRAGAEGIATLTRFLDTFQLWIEKVRQFQDIRFMTVSDLRSPEAQGIRELLSGILGIDGLSPQTVRSLGHLQKMMEPENLSSRLAWIEQRQNGSQMLHSVPERIGNYLSQHLFSRFSVTLLVPAGAGSLLPEILPAGIKPRLVFAAGMDEAALTRMLPVSLGAEPSLDAILSEPPAGKTIILLPGKGMIEDLYVKHTERLEALGVTIICQGIGGGQGRMQAEFTAAKAPALWLLTPWMFEGIELAPGTADHLLIKTLPFDHPSHPVLSRRSQHYNDPFGEYSLPRLLHRLFRLLRTYARFRTDAGDARVMDERIGSKSYGKTVRAYLRNFSDGLDDRAPPALASAKPAKKKKPAAEKPPKQSPDQMTMF